MQRLPNPKFLFLLIFIGIIAACKKNEPLMGSNGFGLLQKSTNANFSQYVSYDASHNVLVFDSFEAIEALFEAIDEYNNNYPMDKGNTQTILDTFNKIRQYGFTMGNGNGGPNTNKVKLQEFQTELLNSYPLSDTVLNGLIDLYDELQPSFPPPFMKTVLEANASFTFEVRENIKQSNLPVGIKNQILAKDDNTVIVPNYAYDDFLGSFTGYQSLYKVLETQQKNQLESGMDPANPLFDNDFVFDEQLRLILNTQREVYIKGNLIKLYDSCRYAIFQGSIPQAYADLARLDANGFVATPTGIIEPATGLTLSTMNTYFPMNYASVNPNYIELKENPREGITVELDAIDSYLSFCPQSLISFSKSNPLSLDVTFNSVTGQNYVSSGTFYQYWTFGDGTGSFQTDPLHVYSAPGFYEVTLTTFNQDCGCWDVEKLDILIGFGEKTCSGFMNSPVYSSTTPGLVTFSVLPIHSNNIDFTVIGWDFDDGSFGNLDYPATQISHQYADPGTYQVTCLIQYPDGCNMPLETTIGISNTQCCDREKRNYYFLNESRIKIFGDNDNLLKVVQMHFGKGSFFYSPQVKCDQTFYVLKNNGDDYKQQKADQSCSINGSKYWLLNQANVCITERTISHNGTFNPAFDEVENKKSCGFKYKLSNNSGGFNFGFGFKNGDIDFRHRVIYGGNDNTKSIKKPSC